MPDSVKSNVYIFADDPKIHKSINSLNGKDILQHDIDNLTKWSSDWLLNLNPDKCKVINVAKNTFKDYNHAMQNLPCSLYRRRKTWGLFSILGCLLCTY